MRRLTGFAALLIVLLLTPSIYAGQITEESFGLEILTENQDGFTAAFDFQTPTIIANRYDQDVVSIRVDLPGSMPDFEQGGPALPVISRLVAVPDGYSVRARVKSIHESAYELAAYADRDEIYNRSLRSASNLPIVEVGEPGWMRWLRVAPVVIRPAVYRADEHAITCADRVEIEFEFVRDGSSIGEAPDPERYWSQAFEDYFQSALINSAVIDNYGFILPGGRVIKRGSYLIITDQSLVNIAELVDFVDWKRRKGFDVVVAPIYRSGIQNNEIKDYIQTAYDEWDRPPEFVLLLGDVNASTFHLPTYDIRSIEEDLDATDQPYVMLKGEDYFMDAFIGRISTDTNNPGDTQKTIKRYLNQERDILNIDGLDMDAFHRAVVFAGNYGDGGVPVLSPVETSQWLADRLREKDYEVYEQYYRKAGDDNSSDHIVEAINRGVNLVCYRGWADSHGTHYPEFYIADLAQLQNEPLLPLFTFFVCRTGDFNNRYRMKCFGEESIVQGSRRTPRGALAFYGPSDLHTKTQYNNPMLGGFYEALMYRNIRVLGPLTLAGKMEIWSGYPHKRERNGLENPGDVEFYTHVYNILGDPEVNIYFDPPFRLDVEHADALSVGDTYTLFTVKDEDGDPVRKALVTLRKTDETEISVLTDGDGEALIPVRLDTEGELEVTVIAWQAAPYLGVINVTVSERNIGFESVVIGDGDDRLEAGQPVDLTVTLRNTGSAAVSGIEATLSCNMDAVEITDATANFGNLSSGQSTQGDAFTVEIPQIFPNNYTLAFMLDITDANDNHYEALFRVTMSTGQIRYVDYTLEGGSIGSGESGNLIINVTNVGPLDLSGIRATIHTHDNSIIVVDDEAVFGDMASGESADCAGNPFRIRVEDGVTDGRQVNMRVALYDENNEHIGSPRFNITIGVVDPTDPIGPDAYGYYAYENIDDHPQAPDYDWIELDPAHDGAGAGAEHHRLKDDSTFVMDLPFEFTFYRAPFNSIAICSNGWVSFEPTSNHINFRNWGMPSPLGPHSMIAPFWEDLVGVAINDTLRDSLDIFTRYDEDEGRFIIEWSRVYARTSVEDLLETFELILFDPSMEQYETETGDGMFLMQYNEAIVVDKNETNYATVGIQDWLHMRGLEITFSNIYHPAAGEITDGRAILFTTDPPDDFLGLNDNSTMQPSDFGISDVYPNPFNARTRINYNLPKGDVIKLMVCDLNGRLVNELENGFVEAGNHTAVLNFESLPSGLYIIRLEAGSLNSQKKLIYIR
jgi:hypothetical protein